MQIVHYTDVGFALGRTYKRADRSADRVKAD